MKKKTGNNQKGNAVKKQPLSPEASAKKTKRIVIIAISIIVGIAILLGAVLGIVAGAKSASYVIKLDNVGIDEGCASYLTSYFKYVYMKRLASSGVNVKDTEDFWSKKAYQNSTYGDYLKYETETYMKHLVAANKLFNEYSKLTSEDKVSIKRSVNEILTYRSGGNKATFNSAVASMGFNYNDFLSATEMIYKATLVSERIFGQSGSNMQTLFPEYCESYYNNYSRAVIVFVRTQDRFVLDEKGEIIKDGEGNYKTEKIDYTKDAEYVAQKNEYMNQLKECVDAINQGSEMYANKFLTLSQEIADKYKENIESAATSGIYFVSGGKYTTDYEKYFSEVVNKVFDMDVGTAAVIDYGNVMADDDNENSFVGMCYIYKLEKEEGGYKNSSISDFFTDFYSLAATSLYSSMLEEYTERVVVKDKWKKIDPIAIPYNSEYVVAGFEG